MADETGIDADEVVLPTFGQPQELIAAPKEALPERAMPQWTAYQLVHDELIMDGSSRINLATFVTTWMEPAARQLFGETLDKNMIDKDEYPQTAEIESRCVRMLANLWHAPDPSTTMGCSTIGSSEACMLGGLALKWRWRQRMRRAGKQGGTPNLVLSTAVQVCWEKFARYFDVEPRYVPVEGDEFRLDPERAAAACDENTIGVVGVLGITYTGQYDDIPAIAAALDRLQAERGLDIPIHVDGASGGFIAPFLQPELRWDFRLPRVKSINTSGHKYGGVFPGVGWVIWRTAEDLPEELIFRVDYLGGEMPTFALNFSRPGAQVVAQYYNFLRLGMDGYRRLADACRSNANQLARAIADLGPFELISEGNDIPVFAWKLRRPSNFSLYDLADRLRVGGWRVPAYRMPASREDLVVQRVVVRPGYSRDMADLLLVDIKRALDYFASQPGLRPQEDGSHFAHT